MLFFTKHAIDKLKREDVKRFKIKKSMLENILMTSKSKTRTNYDNFATVAPLDKEHDLRIIYDIIDKDIKVITFHIARKGRY